MPGGQPMNAKDDPFSPENIAQVAEEISKLTPEQQDQLYKESLDFLSKELNLSPEEVEKMITEEFTQGAAPMPEMPQPTGPSAEALKNEPVSTPKVEEKIVPIKDLNDVANLLKNLADVTDTIMRKASGLPDLPSRVDRWVEQKKLTSWQSHLTWASFKKQLELLVQKLGKLQNKDPRTTTYLYLPELLSNVSLKNNLERIYRTLKRLNTEFATSTFDIDMALDDPLSGAGSLSTEAKDALLGILNTYGDAFYAQNLFKDLDALVQKFDPAAQKLRTAEEASAKKALEASKQTRSTTGIKVGGSKGDGFGGRDGYYGEPSDGGYYPGSYSPGSSYGGYPSSYGTDSAAASDKKDTNANESKKAVPGEKADKESSEKIKWMRETSRDVANTIRSLANEIINNFSSDPIDASVAPKIKDYLSTYKRIESDIKTLVSSSKDLGQTTKNELFVPIQESYTINRQELFNIAKRLTAMPAEKTLIKTNTSEATALRQEPTGIKLTQETIDRLQTLTRKNVQGFETLNKKEISASITPSDALNVLNEIEEANKTPKKVAVSTSTRKLSFEEQIKSKAALFEASRYENRDISAEIEALRTIIKTELQKKPNTLESSSPEAISEPINVQALAQMLNKLEALIRGLPQAATKTK
jgi:hypothetical protein